MNIGNEFWHQEIIDVDLTTIAEQIEEFDTFYDLFVDTVNKAKYNPFRPGWELRYDLMGWCEYKFFSTENPSLKDKPDMRMIYYYDWDYKNIYMLAVGSRNSKETRESNKEHSIYYIAAERLKRSSRDQWRNIR